MGLIDHYEGWMEPKTGSSPYKVIDDPALILKKNKMREVLREEYTRRMYNPYRMAAGVGGSVFDPAVIRYNAMMRTQSQFFRTGPRFGITSIIAFAIMFGICYGNERIRREKSYRYRTGQVAYADRDGRNVL